ncbi:phosphoenolpyruvate--protein phosphotransferase [Effusibacillus pohliae]|uniref:phosphoenolpyruvate--protein phosphotransferase n=1 Tax=Effusibacillus pohliae TaxID=232270 RepID=UPI0003731F30|nr:phosphoenolpyruvate--protein phosphotransferase [Effusibacillus pohliae]
MHKEGQGAAKFRKAIAASRGYSIGKARWIRDEITWGTTQTDNPEAEWERLQQALASAKAELALLKQQMAYRLQKSELQIFDAHLLLLEDPAILNEAKQELWDRKVNAEAVIGSVMDNYAAMLQTLEDKYMQQRTTDIRDVKQLILKKLLGVGPAGFESLDEPVILLAEDLTPSQTASIPTGVVKGFVTMIGGTSSHSAILARSLQIPAVVGAGPDLLDIQEGDEVMVDGFTGEYWVNPSDADRALFLEKKRKYEIQIKELDAYKTNPAVTKDGTRVEVACNIAHPKDVDQVLAVGIGGIGLFRTEFLFMDRADFPTEEEQFLAYKEVLEKMGGKPVIIRTLDIGGDKPLSYFPMEEKNPFLGYRAIRICLDLPELFQTQLRALYRASRFGNLKIMLPMIAAVDEVIQARTILEEVRKQVGADPVPVGIMVETPAAAMMVDQLAEFVDFFSIGSNDLTQYAMAADRTNEKVAYLSDPLHPPVLRMIHKIIRDAHEKGKRVGMCGEMAGDERVIPLLYAMDLDEFSMNAGQVLAAKKQFSTLTRQDCQLLLDRVLRAKTKSEVEQIIQNGLPGLEG